MLMTFFYFFFISARSDYSGANSNSMLYVYLKECMLSQATHFGSMDRRDRRYVCKLSSKNDYKKNQWLDYHDIVARDIQLSLY